MKDNIEIKNASSIWRSRGFCVIATTLILWVWGDIAQPQATSCQVGTYDCAGQLYLSNGRVGIGMTNPETSLHVAGTGAKLRMGPQDTTNEGGEIQLDGAGSNTEWVMDNYQSRFRLHHGGAEYMSVDAAGNLGFSGRITSGTVPLNTMMSHVGNANSSQIVIDTNHSTRFVGSTHNVKAGDLILVIGWVWLFKDGTPGKLNLAITNSNNGTAGIDTSGMATYIDSINANEDKRVNLSGLYYVVSGGTFSPTLSGSVSAGTATIPWGPGAWMAIRTVIIKS